MFFEKRERRKIPTLNVVALIDISSLLIIFLIMGTVFGQSSVVIPGNLTIPKSVSKESVESAPTVTISQSTVTASFLPEPQPLELFHDNDDKLADFQGKLKKYVNETPAQARESGMLLNVIADRTTPYRDIFDVIRVFRKAGFQSMLFISQGK
jgi:biopolymer transport protein ExbD